MRILLLVRTVIVLSFLCLVGIVNDSELVAILSYIKSTWSDAVRKDHDQVNMMYGPYNRAVSDLIKAHPGERG